MPDTFPPSRSDREGWTDELTSFHEDTAGANHFIDRASRRHAFEQLAQLRIESPVILDVGSSSGFMLRFLQEKLPRATVIGSDYVRGPLENIARDFPGMRLFQFDLVTCPLSSNSVDAVILLNVLEHIKEDSAAMRQVYRILKPGGIAVIEVPSNPRLYDVYDKMLMHYRRYSLRLLQDIASNAGFQILNQSHLGFFLYPGFWLTKMRNKRFLAKESRVHRQVIAQNIQTTAGNRLFDVLMRMELSLGKRIAYPFGIRCLMTVGKTKMGS